METRQETVIQGHTGYVKSIAVTSDKKFVVSGSADKTVRIWNVLDKRQESVLEGHTDSVLSVAVTCDNKFVVSGSADKTVRVWNFFEKTLVVVLNYEDSVSSLEVDTNYSLDIGLNHGQKTTVNLKEFI